MSRRLLLLHLAGMIWLSGCGAKEGKKEQPLPANRLPPMTPQPKPSEKG